GQKFDVVFLDPPFRMKVIDSIIAFLIANDMVSEDGFIVAEYPKEDVVNQNYPGWKVKLCRRYASSEVLILQKGE
nr:RsmD family RNA methyltransferase [Bacilli bacterium]